MRVPLPLVVWPAACIYKTLFVTWRAVSINQEPLFALHAEGRSAVICLWHDEIFPLFLFKKHLPMLALISRSRDGDYLAGLYKMLGAEIVRGSSSRGGSSALHDMLKIMHEQTYCVGFATDGPRGPRHKAKPGAIYVSLKTNAPLVPMRLFMDNTYCFKSWDRFQVPLPFSRVTAVFGDPYMPDANPDDPSSLKRACLELENIMNGLHP